MKPQTGRLLEKASRAVRSAKSLLAERDMDAAANRIYYAAFYAAQALLYEKGLTFRRHRGVHSAFAEHFIKTRALDPKFHRWLLDAFDKRLQGDYGVETVLDAEDVSAMIAQASELLQAASELLSKSGTESHA
jgi:uncharacterized protein (UPF0332 family)